MKYIMIAAVLLLAACQKDTRVYGADGVVTEAIKLSNGEYSVRICSRWGGCSSTGYHFTTKEEAIKLRDEFNAQRPSTVEVVE